MRVAAAVIAACLTPTFAAAQPAPLAASPADSALNAVVFVRPPGAAAPIPFTPHGLSADAPSDRWSPTLVMNAGRFGVSVSPHAALGSTALGRTAEAGATVRIGSLKEAVQSRLSALGVKDGVSTFHDQGRFYVFAAVRGQAVGMNLVTAGGGLHRAGWTSDASSALIGDGQVGVGWRRGSLEADLGYVHRGVHVRNAPLGASDSYADDMAALSFTFRPHR